MKGIKNSRQLFQLYGIRLKKNKQVAAGQSLPAAACNQTRKRCMSHESNRYGIPNG